MREEDRSGSIDVEHIRVSCHICTLSFLDLRCSTSAAFVVEIFQGNRIVYQFFSSHE